MVVRAAKGRCMASTQSSQTKIQPITRLNDSLSNQKEESNWWESETTIHHIYWIFSAIVFNIVYGSALLVGLYHYDILAIHTSFWYSIRMVYFLILGYHLWSIYLVFYNWEDGMHEAFYKTAALIFFGMLIWFLISLQGAY